MKLIICEKPHLENQIINGLKPIDNIQKKSGYSEGSQYITTHMFGHMLTLYDIADYEGVPAGDKLVWNQIQLPYIPTKFKKRLTIQKESDWNKRFKTQYKTLCMLINRSDVTEIINCGDADREGQLLVDEFVELELKNPKKRTRLWLDQVTPETILGQIKNLPSNDLYKKYYNEALARQLKDWISGINLTIFVSNKAKTLLKVGPLKVPIVKEIYDRDMKIRKFVKSKYYEPTSKCKYLDSTIELSVKKKDDDRCLTAAAAQIICDELNAHKTIVAKKTEKELKKNPPNLFSLDHLQAHLGKKYKMSLETSMKAIQSLYDNGYLTYPRTNSEYIGETEKDFIKSVIKNFQDTGEPIIFRDTKRVFDNSKIESHSALTPTTKTPNLQGLNEVEKCIYETVRNRFLAMFCEEECIIAKTELQLTNGNYNFNVEASIIKVPGYLKYENNLSKEKTLPELKEGDIIPTNFCVEEKETTPPSHHTVESLTKYLLNPFKNEKQTAEEQYKALFEGITIGTSATRSPTITECIDIGYFKLMNGTYYIEPLGEYLIETLKKLRINLFKEKAIATNKTLIDVRNGKTSVEEAIDITKKEVCEIITNSKNIEIETRESTKEVIGKCPWCGKSVFEAKNGYACENYKPIATRTSNDCGFYFNKKNDSGILKNQNITKAKMKSILGGKCKFAKLLKSSGETYEATLTFKFTKNTFPKIEFDKTKPTKQKSYKKGR